MSGFTKIDKYFVTKAKSYQRHHKMCTFHKNQEIENFKKTMFYSINAEEINHVCFVHYTDFKHFVTKIAIDDTAVSDAIE